MTSSQESSSNHRSTFSSRFNSTLGKNPFNETSFDDEDSDITVITNNLFNTHHHFRHNNVERHHNNKKVIDKKRAPKIAAFILVLCSLVVCMSFVSKQIREEAGLNIANKSSFDVQNKTDLATMGEERMQQMSKPIIDTSSGDPVRLPKEYSNLADIRVRFEGKYQAPIYWHIPRAGGSTIQDITTHCYGLTLASEMGPFVSPEAATQNNLVTVLDSNSGAKYLNVDTTTPEGIERARNFNIAASNDLDLIVSPYIFMASDAFFNEVNRGRLFVIFRHPIERAVSMYYYLRDKTGIRDAQLGEPIDLYARSSLVEDNWKVLAEKDS